MVVSFPFASTPLKEKTTLAVSFVAENSLTHAETKTSVPVQKFFPMLSTVMRPGSLAALV